MQDQIRVHIDIYTCSLYCHVLFIIEHLPCLQAETVLKALDTRLAALELSVASLHNKA